MELNFFAANVWIGKLMDDKRNISVSVEELIKKMDSLNIKKAIEFVKNIILSAEKILKPFLYFLNDIYKIFFKCYFFINERR